MNKKILQTDYAIKRKARDTAIYAEYNELLQQPEAQKTPVREYLCKKYNLGSPTTVFAIVRKMEERNRLENRI